MTLEKYIYVKIHNILKYIHYRYINEKMRITPSFSLRRSSFLTHRYLAAFFTSSELLLSISSVGIDFSFASDILHLITTLSLHLFIPTCSGKNSMLHLKEMEWRMIGVESSWAKARYFKSVESQPI